MQESSASVLKQGKGKKIGSSDIICSTAWRCNCEDCDKLYQALKRGIKRNGFLPEIESMSALATFSPCIHLTKKKWLEYTGIRLSEDASALLKMGVSNNILEMPETPYLLRGIKMLEGTPEKIAEEATSHGMTLMKWEEVAQYILKSGEYAGHAVPISNSGKALILKRMRTEKTLNVGAASIEQGLTRVLAYAEKISLHQL